MTKFAIPFHQLGSWSFAAALGILACSSQSESKPNGTDATTGCNKDTDCKGDRVCENGNCISPSATTGAGGTSTTSTGVGAGSTGVGGSKPTDICGDGVCDSTESNSTCCSDCGCPSGFTCQAGACDTVCGDDICAGTETQATCCMDCGCQAGFKCQSGMCASICGDNLCAPDETQAACCIDCGCQSGYTCQSGTCASCGDGVCAGDETQSSCCTDCGCAAGYQCKNGSCLSVCGDSICTNNETQQSCCKDCGCASGYSCQNGSCATLCGDNLCVGAETQVNCCKDCGCPAGKTCSSNSCVPICTIDQPISGYNQFFPPNLNSYSTIGQDNQFSGSCGGSTAPEFILQWTAPKTGKFWIDTVSGWASFDSVIYIRKDTCNGVELACNNDAPGWNGNTASRVSVNLTSGQTVVIFVDGFAGASGVFILHITDDTGCVKNCNGAHCQNDGCGGICDWTVKCPDGTICPANSQCGANSCICSAGYVPVNCSNSMVCNPCNFPNYYCGP